MTGTGRGIGRCPAVLRKYSVALRRGERILVLQPTKYCFDAHRSETDVAPLGVLPYRRGNVRWAPEDSTGHRVMAPCALPHRNQCVPKFQPSQGCNTGSNPVGSANKTKTYAVRARAA